MGQRVVVDRVVRWQALGELGRLVLEADPKQVLVDEGEVITRRVREHAGVDHGVDPVKGVGHHDRVLEGVEPSEADDRHGGVLEVEQPGALASGRAAEDPAEQAEGRLEQQGVLREVREEAGRGRQGGRGVLPELADQRRLAEDRAQVEEDREVEQLLRLGLGDPLAEELLPGRERVAPSGVLGHHVAPTERVAGGVELGRHLPSEGREPCACAVWLRLIREDDGVVLVGEEGLLLTALAAHADEAERARLGRQLGERELDQPARCGVTHRRELPGDVAGVHPHLDSRRDDRADTAAQCDDLLGVVRGCDAGDQLRETCHRHGRRPAPGRLLPDLQDDRPALTELDRGQRDDARDHASVCAVQLDLERTGRLLDTAGDLLTGGRVRRNRRQDVVEVEELHLVRAPAEELEDDRVGVPASAVDEQDGTLGRGFDQRLVPVGRLHEVPLGVVALALKVQAFADDVQEEQRDDDDNRGRAVRHAALEPLDFLADVLGVEPGADHPAPGLEPPDVGLLGCQPRRVVVPLPDVVDVALVPPAHDIGELDEDPDPARVPERGDVLTVELRAIRVHDDAGREVLQPEVVLALGAVAEGGNAGGCLCLGLHPRQLAPQLGPVRLGQDRHRRVGELADHLALAVEERCLEARQDEREDRHHEQQHREHRGQDDAGDEAPEVVPARPRDRQLTAPDGVGKRAVQLVPRAPRACRCRGRRRPGPCRGSRSRR